MYFTFENVKFWRIVSGEGKRKKEVSQNYPCDWEQAHLYKCVFATQSNWGVCMKNILKTQEGQWHVSNTVIKVMNPRVTLMK